MHQTTQPSEEQEGDTSPDRPIAVLHLTQPNPHETDVFKLVVRSHTLLIQHTGRDDTMVIDPATGEHGLRFLPDHVVIIDSEGNELHLKGKRDDIRALRRWWHDVA